MDLQRAGAFPAQPNRAQAQAIDALGNIQMPLKQRKTEYHKPTKTD